MKQFVKKIQEEKFLVLSLLFLCIAGVGATESPQIFRIITVIVLAFVGIVGVIKVYKRLQSGASDLQPVAMDWFGSLLILTIGNNIIVSFVI